VFHQIASLLTLATMTLHAFMGCCMHHVHAAGCSLHVDAPVASHADPAEGAPHRLHASGSSCPGHHAEHHAQGADSGSQGSGNHQHPSDPCEEADCSFVSGLRCDELATLLSPVSEMAAPGDAAALVHPASSDAAAAFEWHAADTLTAAGRVRALRQVWLL
jgi:hypothetical protein